MNFKKIIHNLIGNKRVLLIIDIILILVAIKGYKSIYNKEYLKNTFEIQSEKFVKENETPVFSLKKVIIYSSAHADDVGEDDVSQLVNISQFTDIALYIDNTGKTTELNEENTISEMFIDNIKITPMPDNQNRIINFKNSIDYGKYVNLSNYEEDGIVFNVLHNNEDRQNSVDGNVFYTDCSNPIVLGYLNKDLLTNCRIGADNGTLVFDGTYFGESEGKPRSQELPDVKESDIEGAVDFLVSLPYVDKQRIGGLGICGSGSYMSVAGVKEPRLKAITAIVPAISDISKSAMAGFFKPEKEVIEAKAAYEKNHCDILYLNFMPRDFSEGAAYYYSARGTHPRWSNKVVAWSQLELIKYNVTNIMKNMKKPYLVITGEKAWSKESSTEVFNAVPHKNKEMYVIPEASHFDLYDLAPYVSLAFEHILPFFHKYL